MTFTPTTTTSAVRASRVKHDALVDKPARDAVRAVYANFETTIIIRAYRDVCILVGEATELPTLIKPVQVQPPRLRALHIVTAAINNHYITAVLPNTEVPAACNLSTCKPRRMRQHK